jgi:hypothetical protein
MNLSDMPSDILENILNYNIYYDYDRLDYFHLKILSLVSKKIRYDVAVYANKIDIKQGRRFNNDELFHVTIGGPAYVTNSIEFIDIVSINSTVSKSDGTIVSLNINKEELHKLKIIIKNGYVVDLNTCESYGSRCHIEKIREAIMYIYQNNRKHHSNKDMRKHFINGAKKSYYCTTVDVDRLSKLFKSHDILCTKDILYKQNLTKSYIRIINALILICMLLFYIFLIKTND